MTLWVLIGIALCVVAKKTPVKARLGMIGFWLILWLTLDSQPRAWIPNIDLSYGEITRVVSLNCAGGDPKAAAEAAAVKADLILLQESPSTTELEELRTKLGPEWTAIHGPDGSILSRGPARRIPLPPGTHNFVAAEWRETLVISVRLQPPIFRLDYWSPDCWRAYAENRRVRMRELSEIVSWIEAVRGNRNLIIGGDFNSPPDRILMAELGTQANDAFGDIGSGWGGTAINTMPLVRIDQIWIGGSLFPCRAFVRPTRHSDHRMVIAEFYLQT